MRIASCYFRRSLIIAIGLVIVTLVALHVLRSEDPFASADDSNLEKLMRLSQLIKSSNNEQRYVRDGSPACKLPRLDISSPEIMQFIHEVPALQCSPEDWVKSDGPRLYIDEKAKSRHGEITCAINEILRIDDNNIELSPTQETTTDYVLRASDYAEVKCETETGKQWMSVLASVHDESDDDSIASDISWSKLPKRALPLNVLMFGFDSLSRQTFARKLPRSLRYLRRGLGGLVLEGYNIVGDGTPQALIPLLTGKIELELPETRKRMGDRANYVDVYPMIWRDYRAAGYRTGFMEDVAHIGTFTYRLKGFDRQPTDHYMRTYYLAASRYFSYFKNFCVGGVPRHSVMLNHIRAVFDRYKHQPKFVFGFHGELSHDSYNDIGAADDDLLGWLKGLKEAGHLNDTLLILMSDHGHRFAEIRNTLQGKQEERLPFFSFTFPAWFKQSHPQAYANFVWNTQRLTTPFDVHATLSHLLDFRGVKDGDLNDRGISLFDKIPIERTCADAFIEPHWCACLAWEEVSVERDAVKEASRYLVDFLNSYTDEHRDICAKLRLAEVLWAARLIPTKGILNFKKSQDKDGFVAELSAETPVTSELYQVKVRTSPGNGLFEASIAHRVEKNIFSTKITDISRINKYGSQARCVENSLFHLRKYCYCND
ncbi:hypothetical protein TKK_0018535 [Trichogramma kaykai]